MASYTISFRTAANLKAKRMTLPFCTDGGGLPDAPAEEAGWLPEPQANSYRPESQSGIAGTVTGPGAFCRRCAKDAAPYRLGGQTEVGASQSILPDSLTVAT